MENDLYFCMRNIFFLYICIFSKWCGSYLLMREMSIFNSWCILNKLYNLNV